MTKSDRLVLSMAIALTVLLTVVSIDSFAKRCAAVRGESLRLHVIANSDDPRDQELKLMVRDVILEQYAPILGAGSDAQNAASLAGFLADDIALSAERALRREGAALPVRAEVTDMYFDTRDYGDGLTLPAGEYTALRVVIGEGEGKNWWCVMYPPLCIPAAVMDEAAAEAEAGIRALSETPGFEARFAVVELAQRLKRAMA